MEKLYLLRHAEAAPKEDYRHDSLRPLTDAGKHQAVAAAAAAKKNRIFFDVILTSPCLRALQTAEIFADAYAMRDQPVAEPALAPGCSVKDIKETIKKYRDVQRVLCVGHEPDLGVIAAAKLGLNKPRPLKKAELVEIIIHSEAGPKESIGTRSK